MYRESLKFINKRLGNFLCYSLFLLDKIISFYSHQRNVKKKDYRNILVIKIAGMGDAVLMLPSLKALKRNYPNAKVSVLVTPTTKGPFVGSNFVDEIIDYDVLGKSKGLFGYVKLVYSLRKRKFDLVLDMEQHFKLTAITAYLIGTEHRVGFSIDGKGRGLLLSNKVVPEPNRHMAENFANIVRAIGVKVEIDRLEPIYISKEAKRAITQWFATNDIREEQLRIGIQATSHKPGSTGQEIDLRRWPKERFAIVADKLIKEYGAAVIFTGTIHERPAVDEIISLMEEKAINAAGETASVSELAALVKQLDLVICFDTAMSHVAAAMGTPTIALFGPDTPRRYAPFGKDHISITKNIACSPCNSIFDGKISYGSTDCPYSLPKCMELITEEDVLNAVQEKLKEVAAQKLCLFKGKHS